MTTKLTDKQILDYKKDGVILIKKVFLPWIEKLSKGFQKVLNKPNKIEDRNAINIVNLYGTANFKILKNIFIN